MRSLGTSKCILIVPDHYFFLFDQLRFVLLMTDMLDVKLSLAIRRAGWIISLGVIMLLG